MQMYCSSLMAAPYTDRKAPRPQPSRLIGKLITHRDDKQTGRKKSRNKKGIIILWNTGH